MLEWLMARYFFHVIDGLALSDDVGSEHGDLASAKCEAVVYAGRLICEDAASFWDRGDWQMNVTDEVGLTLFTLVFAGYDAAATSPPASSRLR
jgi:hypothetical protein